MAKILEWFRDPSISKGQMLGILLAAFVVFLIAEAIINDEVLWYTRYEDGTEAEWRARTGKHMLESKTGINLK